MWLGRRARKRFRLRNRLFFKGLLSSMLALLAVFLGCANPVEKFKNAEKLQRAGEYRAALEQYAQLLERVPADQPEVLSLIQLRMSECLWSLKRPQEAYAALEESLRNNAKNTPAHLRLAQLLLAGADTAGAVEQANLVLKNDPQNVQALSLLGAAFIDAGSPARARVVLVRVLELDPAQVNAALTLAELYARNGEMDEARKVLHDVARQDVHDPRPWLALARLEEIIGNANRAESSYRQAVRAQDSTETKLRLAQFLARQAQITEAEEILRGLDSRDPESSVALPDFDLAAGRAASAAAEYGRILGMPSPALHGEPPLSRSSVAARLVETELQLATQQKQADDTAWAATFAAAKAHLRQFHSYFDPATATALAAEVSFASENLTAAEQLAQQAIVLSPKSAPAHYVLGLVRQRGGLPDLARTEWQSALQAAPGFTPARIALAAQALDSADAVAAEAIISSVVRDEPANFQALCLYARVLMALGRDDQAMMIARRALAASPSSAAPHEIMGAIAVRWRNLGKALIEYEQALLLEPHSQSATRGLTGVYRKGAISRAMLAGIERTAQNPPRSPVLMEIAGRLYVDRGWRSDAERCLRRALAWDPQRASAATALAELYVSSGNARAADALLDNGGDLTDGKSRNSAKTAEEYEHSLQKGDPTGATANNLAWLYAQKGTNLDRALALALKAQMLAPQNPAVLDTLGVVHLKRHEYSKAVKDLETALELTATAPVSGETLLQFRQHLAEAYMRSGQTEAASAVKP
jgi:Tfp pilus assembly protein PilF